MHKGKNTDFSVRKQVRKMYLIKTIKNDITKERRKGLRDDFDYEVFCLGVLHYLTIEKTTVFMDLSITHDLSILFK